MSLNNLNNVGIFPYSLNNLQVIRTSDGSTLPVTCNTPLIETTTTTAQNVKLYESSTDYINFATYSKALEVTKLVANTGTFTSLNTSSLSSTNSTLTNISNTSFTGTNASITNISNTSFTGVNAGITNITNTNITTTTMTGTNAYLTNATIGNLTISGATIPYLRYTTATGTTSYTTNTSATNYYNNANTNPMLYSVNNDTTLSSNNGRIYFRPVGYNNAATQGYIDNLGRLTIPSITVGDEISNNIDNSQKITTANLQVTSAMTGSTIATSSTITSGGVLSTTSGKIQNGNGTWTTNTNDVFINGNNDTIYLRPKGTTATPAAGEVYLLNNGNLNCSTGTFTAWNGYFNNGLNAPNANISCYGITSAYLVSSPGFTGANATINNISCTNLTGTNIRGNFNGNVSVANPQKMYFYQNDGTTECMRIEPAFSNNILSFYNSQYGSMTQLLLEAQASGAYLSYLNKAELKDYIYSPTAKHDAYYTTTANGLQSTVMSFYNDTSNQSRPFVFYNRNQSAYVKAFGSNSYNNGFVIGDSTAERWFIYNKSNTSTLAINNNSSDLVTLTNSLMSVNPQLNVYNTLQVGQAGGGPNALINLGYSGTLGGSPNTRQGYIYMDGAYLNINNQQFNNANRSSSTIGHIQLAPANGQYSTLFSPNGSVQNYNDVYAGAGFTTTNYSTGAYGLYINIPNQGRTTGNNYYALVIQGTDYTPAITMHPSVNALNSNITIGRLNYPTGNESITIRPYSTANTPSFIRVSNNYQDTAAQGTFLFGIWGTGSAGIEADVFLNNYATNASSRKAGIRLNTDTTNYGTTCTAQYIDFTGQTFFNPFTSRGAGKTNSQAGSPLSVIYGFKSLPEIGTLYTTSRGAGNYVTWHKATANNVNYTVAGGTQKIQLADATSVNASPWQVVAGARQYSFRADWSGVYDLRFNLNLFALAATNCFIYVYVNGVMQMTTIAYVTAGNFSFCNGTKLLQLTAGQDVDMRILPDVNTVTVGNNSTIDCIYVG